MKNKSGFVFGHNGLGENEKRAERLFGVIPGFLSLSLLLGMVALSFLAPRAASVCIIAFVLYWLFRMFYMTLFLVISYLRLAMERETDWMARVHELFEAKTTGTHALSEAPHMNWRENLSARIYRNEAATLFRHAEHVPNPDEIFHLVILPIVRERMDVTGPVLAALAGQKFPLKQMVVVLAVEERAPAEVKTDAERLVKKYGEQFYAAWNTFHPDGLPGEGCVKGANATYAARSAADFFKEKGIDSSRVVVSCFDADTIVDTQYFSCLTYHFLVCPNRERASFQPIPVYHNNIWRVPGFARVLDVGASFFQLAEASHPDSLVTFSSHSMSFKALVDVGYWPLDMVSDDSAIFWKALLFYDGDYRVVPMYVTLSMDVADAGSWWKTVKSVYRQKRRWAWGVENFPVVMRGFFMHSNMRLSDRWRHGLKLLESHLAWATWPFLLTLISWLPAVVSQREFSNSVLYYTAPRITGVIFRLASVALLTSIVLSLGFLPKKPVKHSFQKRFLHALEWLLVPVITVILTGLPALDAQLRLMFGGQMDFQVTEKKREKIVL